MNTKIESKEITFEETYLNLKEEDEEHREFHHDHYE